MKTATIVASRPDRFLPRDQKDLTAAQIAAVSEIAGRRGKMPAPYEVLVGSPEIALQFERFSATLWNGAVPALISETVFLITARHFRCAYQWEAHKGKALNAGLPSEIIRAIGQDEPLDDLCIDQRSVLDVYRFLNSLHVEFAVSDRDFDNLAAHFDEVQLSEFMAFCGFAASIAMLLNVRQIGPPATWNGAFN